MSHKKTTGQCIQRKARKLNRDKVQELAEQGMKISDIAAHQGVNPSTVSRFLQRLEPERQALEAFKSNRADLMDKLCAKSLELQERLIDSVDDGIISELTPSQKSGFLMSLNAQAGTLFDKSRLERGESTSNVSLISRMVDTSISTLYKQKSNTRPVMPEGSLSVEKGHREE